MKPAHGAQFTLVVDNEGVVRVVQATSEKITVTADELGMILTGIIKALVGSDDEEQEVEVNLN